METNNLYQRIDELKERAKNYEHQIELSILGLIG